jgi:outer membrane protein, multidrug efflux system
MKNYLISICLLGVIGCQVPKATLVESRPVIPLGFSGETSADTSSSADIERRALFMSTRLSALIDTVVRNNFDLLIAAQRIRSAQAMVNQASGLLRPSVNLAAIPSVRKFGLYTMDGAGNAATDIKPGIVVPEHLPDFFFGAQASWEVDVWGKLKNRKKAAAARFFSSLEGKNLIVSNLVAETSSAYYGLLAADHELRVLDQTIQIQEEAIELVKVQKQAAVVNELAVQQFEAQLLNMRSMRSLILQDIVREENRINLLAGRFYQPIPRDSIFFTEDALPKFLEGLPSALLRNRPDIRMSEWDLQAAKADLVSARALFYPSFNIGATLGTQGYSPSILFRFPESLAYTLLAGFTAPVINRSMIRGEFQKADANQVEALYNYHRVVTRGFNEVYEDLLNIRNLQDVYFYKQKENSALSRSIQVASDLFRTGRADYLEVLLTRQNALRANIELIETRKRQFLAAVALYKALGGGWK